MDINIHSTRMAFIPSGIRNFLHQSGYIIVAETYSLEANYGYTIDFTPRFGEDEDVFSMPFEGFMRASTSLTEVKLTGDFVEGEQKILEESIMTLIRVGLDSWGELNGFDIRDYAEERSKWAHN